MTTTATTDRSLGVWIRTDGLTSTQIATLAQDVEAWGYDTFWFPEILGRESCVNASWLLANTSRLEIATGIANIYLREALTTIAATLALTEQSNDRFVLGLGSSHNIMVEGLLKKTFTPATDLENYINTIIDTGIGLYDSPTTPSERTPIIAALGPRLGPSPARPASSTSRSTATKAACADKASTPVTSTRVAATNSSTQSSPSPRATTSSTTPAQPKCASNPSIRPAPTNPTATHLPHSAHDNEIPSDPPDNAQHAATRASPISGIMRTIRCPITLSVLP